jgi:hypothetical protein
MGLSFTIADGPRQRSHSRVSHSRPPNLEGEPRICIPQEQGDPVITPGTGFSYRHLVRPSGLRWRYSTPPPRGIQLFKFKSQSQNYVTTDGQSASLSWNKAPIWGLRPDLQPIKFSTCPVYNPSARTA